MSDLYSYRKLIVWQKSKELSILIYRLTDNYPKTEIFGITSQIRRNGVSIPSNIAEGSRRSTDKEFRQYLCIAYGSGAELETQLEIAKELGYGNIDDYAKITLLLDEVMRMLNKMIGSHNSIN